MPASEAIEMIDGRAVLRRTEPARARALVFNEEAHTYLVDGREHLSVTRVVSFIRNAQGYDMPDFEPIHAELGTAMHRAIELDILDDLDIDTVDERIINKVRAARAWRESVRFEPAWMEDDEGGVVPALELRLWSPTGAAGTVDAVGYVNGELTVCDWKSSYVGGAAIQMAAYVAMLRFMFGVDIERRLVVKHLNDGTHVPLPFTDPLDGRRFAAGLFLARDAVRNGRTR